MKMKSEKRTVFRFPFFYENEKQMRVLKIQSKTLLNMKLVVKSLNFVFHIEVKTKSNYKILNFVFQFIKNLKWHFGYTDCYITQKPLLVLIESWKKRFWRNNFNGFV